MLKSGEFKKHDHLIERLMEEGFSSTDIASALLSQLFAGDARPADAAPVRPTQKARAPLSAASTPATAVAPKLFSPPSPPAAPAPIRPPRERREEPPFRERTESRDFKRADTRALSPARPTTPRPGTDRVAAVPSRPATSRPVFSTGPAVRPEMQRLIMNLGSEAGVAPKDVVGAILGETGLPPQVVGAIQIEADHLFVEVAAEHSEQIMRKLERTRIKGQRPEIGLAHPIRRPAKTEWKKK